MTQTDSWSSWCVAKEFPSLVSRATVQHGPSPTGLTHLGLTARWRSLQDTAPLLSSSSSSSPCAFHVQLSTLYPSRLLLSSLPQRFLLLLTKEGCRDAKKMVLIFYFSVVLIFIFFLTSNLANLFVLVVSSSVTTTVKHVQYHLRLLMSTSLVLSLSSQPQALVVRAHIGQILCVICGWSSLGASNTEESVTSFSRIQYYSNIPAPTTRVGQLDVLGLWMLNVFPASLSVVFFSSSVLVLV